LTQGNCIGKMNAFVNKRQRLFVAPAAAGATEVIPKSRYQQRFFPHLYFMPSLKTSLLQEPCTVIAVIQRVSQASVVAGSHCAKIDRGALILIGVARNDEAAQAEELASRVAHLRIFEDREGKMNLSLLDVKGAALVVSQFTLTATTDRGRRPGFDQAAPAPQARFLYEHFVAQLQHAGVPTQTGVFGAHMAVQLTNDGPVTLIVKSKSELAAATERKGKSL
jgi:D-tyrosyl-tRNA(Tyr) deacylase